MKIKTPLSLAFLVAAFTAFASATPAPATAMLESMKVSAASNSFASDIQLAHSEAGRRGTRVGLCKSADGASCAHAGAWSQGWIVFEDSNGNGARDAEEPLIVRVPAFSRSLRFAGNLESVRAFSFAPTGGVKLAGGLQGAGVLTICSEAAPTAQARRITLQPGRVPQLRDELASGCA